MAPSELLTQAYTSKRQKVAHDVLFPAQYLPVPVVRLILSCLDIPSLAKAAGCNRSWRKEVYENHPHLWSVMEFSAVKGNLSGREHAAAARITDRQLSSLLHNCRAVENCKVLSLRGCLSVRGHGMEPLRGSSVLQEIDLRLMGPVAPDRNNGPKVNASAVLSILSSMPPLADVKNEASASPRCCSKDKTSPLGLSLVKFDTVNEENNYYVRFPAEIGDWLHDFHQALQARAEHSSANCGYCQGHLQDGSFAYCEHCRKYSCGEGTCPSTWFCLDCLVQCCQPMGRKDGQCPNHKMIFSCKSCDRLQCEGCFDGIMCANDDCCNEYCSSDGCLDSLQSCPWCQSENDDKFYCPKCISDHEKHCPGPQKDGPESRTEVAV